jgi:cobalt-zinc-cadmium resistance protein CzcA
VGVNVRNRDLQSVVDDIQAIVKNQITIPEGYRVDYGGQFENLQQARNRLLIAVPVALVLIFVLLFFAFSSTRDAFMIYTAIPFSAIGGILLLWLRDMPFSISAGVGFIALFGIAVLNGIVMIEHFKSMKHKYTSIRELVITGAKERLRPVLLTASAAALGFLPMAISGSAGAEVQRPLATVVVGGLISATLLTLVVLPVLYVLFNSGEKGGFKLPKAAALLVFFLISPLVGSFAQQSTPLTLQEALQLAEKQNPGILASQKRLESATALTHSAWDLPKTNLIHRQDQNDIAENGVFNRVWGINQSFAFPTVYSAQKSFLRSGQQQEEAKLALDIRALKKEVSTAYVTATYWIQLEKNYNFLDSLYGAFSRAATRRLETGESNLLEKLTADSKQREISIRKSEAQRGKSIALDQLARLLQIDGEVEISEEKINLESNPDLEAHPGFSLFEAAKMQAFYQTKVNQHSLLPTINLDLFQGTNLAPGSKVYPGFEVGVGIPLFFGSQSAKIKAGKITQQQIDLESENFRSRLETSFSTIQKRLDQNQQIINYYETEGKILSEQLRAQASRSFQEGEIDFLQYVQLVENSRTITLQYLQARLDYQLNQLELLYLVN